MSNKVIRKEVYCIVVSLKSPVCISQGDGVLTDNDVLVNGSGTPFIPGSSLAGSMRGYLNMDKNQPCVFGFEDYSNGRMSSVFVSDLYFDSKVVTTVRDGVKLSDKKTAVSSAKYDMEVIDTGAKGHFYLEVVFREQDDETEFESQLIQVFQGWKKREIRLGSKKTRGYGELSLESIKRKVFTKENFLQYKDAYCSPELQDETWEEYSPNTVPETEAKYVTLTLPLKLEGGISIRQYGVKKGEPDFVHITANGLPVIPGTSFNGAIRHRLRNILEQLAPTYSRDILETLFGYVHAESDKSSRASNVIVGECVIEGAQKMVMVRNGISRFESGSKDGALFQELTYVGGRTTLEIKVQRTEEIYGHIGLLLLVLKDIQNGFLSVGGQTAVGRGLFSADGEISIDPVLEEGICMNQAYAVLIKGEVC